jgi:hypothetical protein
VLAGGPLAPATAQQASIVTRMGILIRQDRHQRPGHRRADRLRAAREPASADRRADRLGRHQARTGVIGSDLTEVADGLLALPARS